MNEKRTDVGVIVGRFHVPELHEAHVELIDTVVKKHSKVIMFLGLAPIIGTIENPLDFESRKKMIQEKYPDIIILYIKDVRDDEKWSKSLDEQIKDMVTPTQTVTLYGGREGFLKRYSGKYPCVELEAKAFISGTEIRNQISKAVKGTKDFRTGVIWAVYNRYPTTFTTVDVAILNENGEVMLGRKPGEKLYQFIGGFSTPTSMSFEEDAVREVSEETGTEISRPEYIGSSFIRDWRYRGERDKIKTIFYKAKYLFGGRPSDDELAEVRWFKIEDLNQSNLQDFHLVLLDMLKKNLGIESQAVVKLGIIDTDKVSKKKKKP